MSVNISFMYSLFFCIWFLHFEVKCDTDYLILLERSEPVSGDRETLLDFSQFKVIKKDGNYFFEGEIELKIDVDNTFKLDVVTSLSSQRNSKYVRLPYKLNSRSACDAALNVYKIYLEESFKGHTNFEPTECPIQKGVYNFRGVLLDSSKFPRSLPRGMLRVSILIYEQQNVVGGVIIYANIIDKE